MSAKDTLRRLDDLEELIDTNYEKLTKFQKRLDRTASIREEFDIEGDIPKIKKNIRDYEIEYWLLLKRIGSSCNDDLIPEDEASKAIVEIVPEVEIIQSQLSANYPDKVIELLLRILDKLNEPETPAAAKAKFALSLIPGILSYEIELDTENSLRRAFLPIRHLFRGAIEKKKLTTADDCPYRGLSAFREDDKKFFFGRKKFIDSLVEVVNQQPLVVLTGASGSGKSSLVFAGLIPKLREKENWLIESFRPNKQPFYELAAALINLLEPELGKTDKNIKAKELAESIRKHGFAADVSAILKYNPKRLLLVVDQFEELYTGCADTEQQQFVDTLLTAFESASRRLTLVLTLREDFYSYLVKPPLGEVLNEYPIKNLILMSQEEMRSVIERPAKEMDVKLEEGLTERILNDVKQEPGNLPLLEFALTQLWEKQSLRVLTHQGESTLQAYMTHQAYRDIGGVAKALSNHAEAVYSKLSVEEQKQAKRIFLQLVRPGEGTEDTRQLATREEVGEDYWKLISRLADERLVVTGRNEATGKETVEVVHEALIREWSLLRQWIDENRKKLTQKREIEDAAKRWRDRGKAKDDLLRGKVLTQARIFQKEQAENLRLSDLAKDFIQESLRRREDNRISVINNIFPVFVPRCQIYTEEVSKEERKMIKKLLQMVKASTPQIDVKEKIQALEKLVEFGYVLREFNFSKANLSGADLRYGYFQLTKFNGADLRGADLRGADLRGADLRGADLRGADLRDATLGVYSNYLRSQLLYSPAPTDFIGAKNLTPEQVKSTKNWQQAIYDEEFRKKLGLK